MSWNEAFTERYDEWAAHMTEDVAFYVSLAREADGPVAELAVGTASTCSSPAARPNPARVPRWNSASPAFEHTELRFRADLRRRNMHETAVRGV